MGAFSRLDSTAQSLVVDIQPTGDLAQRTIRGMNQLDRVLAELLRTLRRA
jgi:hypothetical protein